MVVAYPCIERVWPHRKGARQRVTTISFDDVSSTKLFSWWSSRVGPAITGTHTETKYYYYPGSHEQDVEFLGLPPSQNQLLSKKVLILIVTCG